MKFIYFILFAALLSQNCLAQRVENEQYELLLKTLLKSDVPEISIKEADSLFHNHKSVIFIDTREKDEFETSHIKGAIWAGYNSFKMKHLKDIDKNKKIIVYCSVGARSEEISRKLMNTYTDVNNLYGGLFEWVNQGKTVVDSKGKLTQKIHAYNKKWGVWIKNSESKKVYE